MSPLPSQQRFALSELEAENDRRAVSAGRLDEHRAVFFLERLCGPPVEGHALIARSPHRLVCECGKWRLWVWSSLRRDRLEADTALRHEKHRRPKVES